MTLDRNDIKFKLNEILLLLKKSTNFCLVLLLSFFYVLKQTQLNTYLIELIVVLTSLFILIENYKLIFSHIINCKDELILIIISLSITDVLFGYSSNNLFFPVKLIFIYCLYIIDKEKNYEVSKTMAVGFFIAIVYVSVIYSFGKFNSTIVTNGVWIKNSLGFLNPNIGPFFLASILFVCILRNNTPAVIVIYLLIYLGLLINFYSRTIIVFTLILLFLFIILQKKSFFTIFSIFFFKTLILINVIVFILYTGLININNSNSLLNFYSSNRYNNLFTAPFVITNEYPLIKVKLLDGIIFEFLIIFGLPLFVVFVYKIYENIKKANNLQFTILSLSLLTFGFFDGIFNKLSPIFLYFFHITFNSFRININVVKIFTLFGIFLAFFLYSFNVYRIEIKSSIPLSYEFIVSPVESSQFCNRIHRSINSSNEVYIELTGNDKNLLLKCSKSIVDLLVKDFDDEYGINPHPIFFENIIFLNKKLSFAHILIIIFVFIISFILINRKYKTS